MINVDLRKKQTGGAGQSYFFSCFGPQQTLVFNNIYDMW